MVHDTAAGEATQQLMPLDLWKISFVVTSLALIHKASAFSDSIEPRSSIEGFGKGSTFAAFGSIETYKKHTKFDVLIDPIPHQWELGADPDNKLQKGLIEVKYFPRDDEYYDPEAFSVQVFVPPEVFKALCETVRGGKLKALWFEGSPKSILISKDQEFHEPHERILYPPSEVLKTDNPFERFWPLTNIVWSEAETVLIPETIKVDPEVEAARMKRRKEHEEALSQIETIQTNSGRVSYSLSQIVTTLRPLSILATLILVTLFYIAYAVS